MDPPPVKDPIALIAWIAKQVAAGLTGQTIRDAILTARKAAMKKAAKPTRGKYDWVIYAVGAWLLLSDN